MREMQTEFDGMRLRQILKLAQLVVVDPRVIGYLARWPVFSLSSYTIVSSLKRLGIIPQTVIDVGANIGQFSVAACSLIGKLRVIAFEPLPQEAAALRQNLRGCESVEIHETAIADRDGRANFHVNAFRQSSSLFRLGDRHRESFPSATEEGIVEVGVARLDSLLRAADLPQPVLLKIDCQGAEAEVLRGATETLARVAYVVVEATDEPLYVGEAGFRDIQTLLESSGFRFQGAVGELKSPVTGARIHMDALFVRGEDAQSGDS